MATTLGARSLIRGFQEARQRKSLYKRMSEFTGFVPVRYETDEFLVTTAKSGPELLKALELRHEVFVKEWQNRRHSLGLDVDDFDFGADHLMIVKKKDQQVIGTYRLISSHFSHDFYSASEFEMDRFSRLPAVKLEMGRACIHADYRNGNTIDLLWKGLTRYIFATKTEYLFGCSSLKTTDSRVVSKVYKTLRDQEAWSDEFHVRATWDYQFSEFKMNGPDALSLEEKREFLPPLLRSYLHAGAKVYGWPALDRDFACTDLFTILDWKKLNPKFQARFLERVLPTY